MPSLGWEGESVPKGPNGQKRKAAKAPTAPKSKKLPRKLPDDPISRAVQITREATEKATKQISSNK
jgi:hypothetical protein